MLADLVAERLPGRPPFLSGFPPGIALRYPPNYLLVALLAVAAALIGVGFKTLVYKIEDLCDRLWGGRPEWARPAVGGARLGLLLLALPQLYGVGYPVMYKAVAGDYRAVVPAHPRRREDLACQPDPGHRRLGRGVRPLAVHRRHRRHGLRRDRRATCSAPPRAPALYAVVAMGAVFAAAARPRSPRSPAWSR